MDKLVLLFVHEKTTKRTVRFREIPYGDSHDDKEDSENVAIGPLYVRKHALAAIGGPSHIKVTVEPAD